MFEKISTVLSFIASLKGGHPKWKLLGRLVTGLGAAEVKAPVQAALAGMSDAARARLATRLHAAADALDKKDFAGAADVVGALIGDAKI